MSTPSLDLLIKPKFDLELAPSHSHVNAMASTMIGSEILKIAGEIRALAASGREICNLTVGDFNSKYFPIPTELKEEINLAYETGETNYPPSDGIPSLRKAVQQFYARELGLEYPIESILITGGARPAIFGTYKTVVEPGDKVVYPVPSWNNNHYCHLSGARGVPIVCSPEDFFLPTSRSLEGQLKNARLLALCSPLNPSGTMFSREALLGICEMVLEENKRRKGERPLYMMFDQVYWMLTFGTKVHYDPVSLIPELAPYTIFVDGISKAFASTGLRVGWAVAPPKIAQVMSNYLGHIGAWAPKPEQVATANFLNSPSWIEAYHSSMKPAIESRLKSLHDGFTAMNNDGLSVHAIQPMGAIYLTVQFALTGKRTPTGDKLSNSEDVRKYLLEEASLAVVPFQAFGSTDDDGWFRLSVGAVSHEEIASMFPRLSSAIGKLQ